MKKHDLLERRGGGRRLAAFSRDYNIDEDAAKI